MFTGIITHLGTVVANHPHGSGRTLRIASALPMSDVQLGASIACNGICLTVVQTGNDWFEAHVSEETLRVTTLSQWNAGARLNLERALRLGDELGGHMVSGHVDGVATLTAIEPRDESWNLTLTAPPSLTRYIATKGSVALDGISLTVNQVDEDSFQVRIIPHTWNNTTLGLRKTGDALNLEIDIFARYIERLQARA